MFTVEGIKFPSISTDTRTLKKNALFIPLVGPKYDGHKFIPQAWRKGARGTLTTKKLKNTPAGKIVIQVKDTLKALQDIARFHRQKFKIPVVGITGSTGKTTTKDMIAAVLAQMGPALKTEENLNNEIGVPLTLLKLNKKHKAAVIEMAMQGRGEIEELAWIAQPTVAVITNIGETHLEHLRTQKNIALTKKEILKFLKKENFALLNADDDYFKFLKDGIKKAKVIPFGIKNKTTFSARDIKETKNSISFRCQGTTFQLPLPGQHNIYNALPAIAIGMLLKIPPKKIAAGLKNFTPSSKRMEIITRPNKVIIINDTYNANPTSMKAALQVLRKQSPRRIAILGDMFELGKRAIPAHKEIGKEAAASCDILIAVGKLSSHLSQSARKSGMQKVYWYPTNKKAAEKLSSILSPGDTALIKGSRSMKMEEIVNSIFS